MRFKESSFILLILFIYIDAANILALFPVKLKSHYSILDTITTELASRGHNITIISSFPKSKKPNITVIDVSECITLSDATFSIDKFLKIKNLFSIIYVLLNYTNYFNEVFSCEPMQRLLNSSSTFDLHMIHIYNSNVMLALKKKFQAPHIYISVGSLMPWSTEIMGSPDNPSYISYPNTDYPLNSLKSTFFQRLYNMLGYITAKLLFHYYLFTDGQRAAKKYFNVNYSQIQEYAKNTSLMLTFSHFSINTARPLLPNVIEISGLQIKNASSLPKEIEKFINESEHGVIYFSMGSLLKSETMSEAKRKAFLHVFSKVPQRVLWKWNNDTLPGKTSNIFVSKWFPQRDVLSHPNIKLFISHGGALGLSEAIYEGVPILGIPIFMDQILNLKIIESQGAAEILEYTDINEKTVLSKIELILKNNTYLENMKKMSMIYKDRPMSAMNTAIYWIEYVIRHKGAPHLCSAAVDLPLYQYLLLDVIAFCTFILITLLIMFYYCFKILIKFARTKSKLKRLDLKKRK